MSTLIPPSLWIYLHDSYDKRGLEWEMKACVSSAPWKPYCLNVTRLILLTEERFDRGFTTVQRGDGDRRRTKRSSDGHDELKLKVLQNKSDADILEIYLETNKMRCWRWNELDGKKVGMESEESLSQRRHMSRQQIMLGFRWKKLTEREMEERKSDIEREEVERHVKFKERRHSSSSLVTRGTFEVTY